MKIIKGLKKFFSYLTTEPEEDDDYLSEGEKIWEELTEHLPPAVGHAEQDSDRLQQFKEAAVLLPADKLEALKAYLTDEVDWYKDEPDPAVPKTVEYFHKWYEIYRLHLEILP